MIGRVSPATQLLDEVARAVSSRRPEQAVSATVQALAAYASAHPADARALLSDSLPAGGPPPDARDRLLDELALIVEKAHARLPASAAAPDLPTRLICAVTCRLISSRLRRGGERALPKLAEELIGWVAAYQRPVARHTWHTLAALPAPARSPYLPARALRAPPAPAAVRTRTSNGAIAENLWLRTVFATAEVVQREGYASATVAQISAAAGIDPRAFHRLFAGKHEALVAANELLFRHAMAVAAGAFVAGKTWPEHVWEAARALTQYAEQNQTLTYVSLVESHAAGASARVEDLTRAFTIFLCEGARQPPRRLASPSSRLSEPMLEAIGTAGYELCYSCARERGAPAYSTLHAQLVFIALTPFLGAQTALALLVLQARSRPRASLRSARPPARYRRTAPGTCR